ncbi:hypothetical protein K435DRAFT_812003 [Dendrothele bispora CBS 962.96]|uniref:Uncharacterized protein n=1 Tax=Dendrothele bispora (strain CBS 962.96) TaxID=1314807 RepID=A0A4S8KQJ6_DENBC|nr:hypothetical protein K435DRAFT_812003 [Dendrothele bispora CBS 962.96]
MGLGSYNLGEPLLHLVIHSLIQTYIQLFTSTSPTTPAAKFHCRKLGILYHFDQFVIFTPKAVWTHLEIYPAGHHIADEIFDDNKDDSKKKHVIVPTDIDFEGYWVKKDESKPRDPETYVKRISSESGKEKKIVSVPTEINDDIH